MKRNIAIPAELCTDTGFDLPYGTLSEKDRLRQQAGIKYSHWFSTPRGTIGIVIGFDQGELKAYIGQCEKGATQLEDEEFILQWGAEFPLEAALDICCENRSWFRRIKGAICCS